MSDRISPLTQAVHAGRDTASMGAHVPLIDLSTTYALPDVTIGGDSYETLATGGNLPTDGSAVYQRLWNPTVAQFEAALAQLEETTHAVAYATGMAAITACVLASVAAGKPHIVAVRPLYGGTDHLLASGLLGATVSWAEPTAIAAALQPGTGLVIVETPANPNLQLLDLDDVRRQAGDVAVLVDNTFATPVLQRPARHGADLILHSATKFIGGHGDAMGGIVACDEAWAARLRQVRAITGALLHPWAAYMLHRGLQTLPARVRMAQDGAAKLARQLAEHPSVIAVHYPGLPECDPHGLVGRQMSGPGSILSFELSGGLEAAAAVANRCQLITHAVSLGGVDTLIQHPASLTHRPVTADAKPEEGLLRVSVGLEDPADLWADLLQALG